MQEMSFFISVEYEDTLRYLYIVNQIYITNTLVSTFNNKLNIRKEKLTEQQPTLEDIE